MTWEWSGILKVVFAAIGICGFVYFLLMKFVDFTLKGYDLDAMLKRDLTVKQQNDEISRQVEESETPACPSKLEPESPKQFRKKWNWGIGEK